jgi:hypothetical protein
MLLTVNTTQAVNVHPGEYIGNALDDIEQISAVTLGHGTLTFHFPSGHDITRFAGQAVTVFSE